jgi:hypothetical protein
MPSTHEQVHTPPELRGIREQPPQPQRETGPVVAAVLSLLMLVLATGLIGTGVGLWIAPGAGMAAAGLCLFVVGVLLGYRS